MFKPTEHDQVGRVSVHISGIERAVEQLSVSTTAVNVLLVFDCELEDQGLVLVGEGLELGGRGVELGILKNKTITLGPKNTTQFNRQKNKQQQTPLLIWMRLDYLEWTDKC